MTKTISVIRISDIIDADWRVAADRVIVAPSLQNHCKHNYKM